jgi:hypothetical protein
LARRAGISVRALRDIEQDRVRHPHQWSLWRLAAALRLGAADQERLLAAGGQLGVGVLGPLVVGRGGVAVEVGQPMLRRLLGLLAIQPGQVVPRGEIVDVLWGEAPPQTCLELVHTHVARLRGLLGLGRRSPGLAGHRNDRPKHRDPRARHPISL